MFKKLLACCAGFAVGMVFIYLWKYGAEWLFPLPQGTNLSDPRVVDSLPQIMSVASLLWLLLGFAIGSFACGWVTTFVGGDDAMLWALFAGFLVMQFGIADLLKMTYPTWFVIANLWTYVPISYVGHLVGERK